MKLQDAGGWFGDNQQILENWFLLDIPGFKPIYYYPKPNNKILKAMNIQPAHMPACGEPFSCHGEGALQF